MKPWPFYRRNYHLQLGPFWVSAGRFNDDYSERMYYYAWTFGIGELSISIRYY